MLFRLGMAQRWDLGICVNTGGCNCACVAVCIRKRGLKAEGVGLARSSYLRKSFFLFPIHSF